MYDQPNPTPPTTGMKKPEVATDTKPTEPTKPIEPTAAK